MLTVHTLARLSVGQWVTFNMALDNDEKLQAVRVSLLFKPQRGFSDPKAASQTLRVRSASWGEEGGGEAFESPEEGAEALESAEWSSCWRELERAKEREGHTSMREEAQLRARGLHAKLNVKSPRARVENHFNDVRNDGDARGSAWDEGGNQRSGGDAEGNGAIVGKRLKLPYFEPVVVPKLRLPCLDKER